MNTQTARAGPNPSMFELARESRGLTKSELARRLGVAQGTISKVENGTTPPSEELIAKYSRELSYPRSFFFANLEKRNLPVTFHRKRKTLPSGVLRRVEAEINIRRLHVQRLLASADVPECNVPSIAIGPDNGFQPRQVGADLRVAWNCPRGPIASMTRLLEDNGVLVMRCDFGTPKIDGISLADPMRTHPPVVFLNAAIPGDRARFTLAHELAHLVLHHDMPIPPLECESEADEFASEFLMPAADIRGFFARVTLDSLFSMKQHWKVSVSALIMRAGQLGRLSPQQKQRLYMQMNAQGIRNPEPYPIAVEEPTLIPELVEFHYSTLEYSDEDLATALYMVVDEMREKYRANSGPQLRLVKL